MPPGLVAMEVTPRGPYVAAIDFRRVADRDLASEHEPPFWLQVGLMPREEKTLLECVTAWVARRKLGHHGNITEDANVALFSRTTGIHTVVDVLFMFDEGHVALIEVGLLANNDDALRAEAFGLALARWTYGLDVRCPMIPSDEEIYAGKFDAA
jgi:hypothetical protein